MDDGSMLMDDEGLDRATELKGGLVGVRIRESSYDLVWKSGLQEFRLWVIQMVEPSSWAERTVSCN